MAKRTPSSGSKSKATRKPAARRSKPTTRSAKPRGKRAKPGSSPEPRQGLSLERKLDIAGVLMVMVAGLTLLSFFSANRSALLESWYRLWASAFGLGVYGFPLGLGAAGLWLVLRHFGDRLPQIAPERIIGILLLYLAFLTTVHFLIAPTPAGGFEIAREGRGGGLVGALALSALLSLVGQLGSALVLAALWIIGIMFTASLSVPELARLLAGGIRKLRRTPAGPHQPPLPDPGRPAAVSKAASPRTPPPPHPGTPAPSHSPAHPSVPPAAPAPDYDQPMIIGGQQHWELPSLEEMLEVGVESHADDEYDRQRAHLIEETLAAFGAPARVVEVNRGPAITQFGVEPDFVPTRGGKRTKVKVSKIAALANDLALALAAASIRVQAPVPGRGYVGIEVPNLETTLVSLRDVIESEGFRKLTSPLAIGLGQDVSGQPITADLAAMPHLLIAGTTGSGKSVCVNAIITCLLLNNTPDDLKLLMVDPKRVELTSYNGIPHLLAPIVVDLERVVAALKWVSREMDERYRRFAGAGARNITDYNQRTEITGEKKLPYLVVVIDELADLMMLAPDETERTIARLAQLARATGIHLVISTQRPSVDVITGLIKANFPARISFAVASSVDSRVVLDQPGAERLLGRGDMLFQSPDAPAPLRMQGVFVSEIELQRIVRYWKSARGLEEAAFPALAAAAKSATGARPEPRQRPLWEDMAEVAARAESQDELLDEAIQVVRDLKKASISLLQRRLRIGYTRAARMIDTMEEMGIVGPARTGAQPREVLDYGDAAETLPTGETRTWTAAR